MPPSWHAVFRILYRFLTLWGSETRAWVLTSPDTATLARRVPYPLPILDLVEIAEFTKGSLSRLSHAFNRLEAKGWVTRAPDPTNGRVTLASLTNTGHAKVVESAPGHVDLVRQLVFDPLTETQVEQLADTLQQISQAVNAQTC